MGVFLVYNDMKRKVIFPPADERAYPCESTNELLIVCSSTKLMASIDLINLNVAGY